MRGERDDPRSQESWRRGCRPSRGRRASDRHEIRESRRGAATRSTGLTDRGSPGGASEAAAAPGSGVVEARRRRGSRSRAVTQPESGLLDTSTVILLGRLQDPSVLPVHPLISAITLAELSVGPLVATSDEARSARQAHLQQAEADFEPLPFDAVAARAFGGVAASLRRSGRKTAARAYDAMIAAIALANDLPLFTCNPDDFAGIDGLTVVEVPHPDRAKSSTRRPTSPRAGAHRGRRSTSGT